MEKRRSDKNTPFDGLMAFSDANELWGLKAVIYGKLVNGVNVYKFGKQ